MRWSVSGGTKAWDVVTFRLECVNAIPGFGFVSDYHASPAGDCSGHVQPGTCPTGSLCMIGNRGGYTRHMVVDPGTNVR